MSLHRLAVHSFQQFCWQCAGSPGPALNYHLSTINSVRNPPRTQSTRRFLIKGYEAII